MTFSGRLVAREAYAFLVGAPVFNTGERRYPSLASSIPVRLRFGSMHLRRDHGGESDLVYLEIRGIQDLLRARFAASNIG